MTWNTNVTTMDLLRDDSPSQDSQSSQISYTNDFETLPADGPASHAHIIDIGEDAARVMEYCSARLQDAIVTTLFNVSADTLKSFLSPTVNNFKTVLGKRDVQLVIWRRGLEVFVGTFEHHTSMKTYRFEQVAGFLIGYDGSWHLKVTASNAHSAPKWAHVWAGKFTCYGGVAKMTVETEQLHMAKRASDLAGIVIHSKYWELKTEVKIT